MRAPALLVCSGFLLLIPNFASAQSEGFTLKVIPHQIVAEHQRVGDYLEMQDGFQMPTAWITRHGWQPTGPGVAVFDDKKAKVPNFDKRRRANMQMPLNVYGTVLPEPDLGRESTKLIRTKPVLVLSLIHHGDPSDIGETYSKMFVELKKRNLKFQGVSREVYLEYKNMTEVQLVVEPKNMVSIGIYADQGVNPDGVLALSLCLADANISFMAIGNEEINSNSFAKKVAAILMPGGWAEQYNQGINEKGAKRLQNFVEDGGGYLGICAGAFYSAKEIKWAGETIPYDIDLFPGVPSPPTFTLPAWPGYTMAEMDIQTSHPLATKLPKTIQVLYYGGPSLNAKTDQVVSVLARFANGRQAAIVSFEKERGRVFLSAVHLEYDLNSMRDGSAWPELESGFTDSEPDWELLQDAVKWVSGVNTK